VVDSVVKTLGAGSGIDYASLVDSLVSAQFAGRKAAISKQSSTLNAQISAVGRIKSGITDFSNALDTLVKGGSLATAPTSSDTTIVKVSGLSGAKLSGLSASIEVRQLAAAQSVSTAPVADRTASVGTGKLTITLGTATVAGGAITAFTPGAATPIDVTIDSAHSSLDEIAKAINAAKAGVTATVLTDSAGARLALKGATGEAQAFTVSATEDAAAPGLAALNVGVGATGTTIGTVAKDAIVSLDGVVLKRASNSISDLLTGVKLDLVAEAPGKTVALGTSAPTDNLRQAVQNFVDTYNQIEALIKDQTSATNGPLFGDTAARSLLRSIGQITSTTLAPADATVVPRTLSEIGVATNRDGTLSVDSARLTAALTNFPDAVEALFAPGTGASDGGISAALAAITKTATDATYGLGASETRYNKALSDLSAQTEKADSDAEQVRNRLSKQFAGSDARIAAYKSTQSFLTQQFNSNNSKNN